MDLKVEKGMASITLSAPVVSNEEHTLTSESDALVLLMQLAFKRR